MKFMQHIHFHAFITYIYLVLIDQLIIIIYTIFKLWELWGILGKSKYFLMTSYPLKMTSYHSQILLIARFWVDLFEKTVVVGIQPTSCLLNFHTCTLLFDFKLEKPLQSKRKSINQTLFSTKSTTLNPMVKSDLVTYRGVTMPNLFLQATNNLSSKTG